MNPGTAACESKRASSGPQGRADSKGLIYQDRNQEVFVSLYTKPLRGDLGGPKDHRTWKVLVQNLMD